MTGKERPAGRALVTFSRSWQALTVIRSLGSRGVEVFAGDELAFTPGALSKYSLDSFRYPSPATDESGFVAALEEAVQRFRPPDGVPYVLLPVHRETYVVARYRDRFEPHVAIALPSCEQIERVRDKGRLARIAEDLGISTPRTWTPEGSGDLEKIGAQVAYPAFVKVRRGVAGVGIEKVEDAESLRKAWADLSSKIPEQEDPPIIQEAAPGDDYCVTALLDHGQVRAKMTYRNLRVVSEAGPGAVRQTVEAPEPEAAGTRLLESLDWHGIAEVDFLWSGHPGDPARLIEVNPRLFSGLFQAVASGVDYAWMLYRLALGETVEPPERVDLEVVSETPVAGLLATLRDATEEAVRWERLQSAWGEAVEQVGAGSLAEGLRALWTGLKEELDPAERQREVKRLLQEREAAVSQLFSGDDAMAALGLLYPLAIFLRHGRVTRAMLAGAEPIDGEPPGS